LRVQLAPGAPDFPQTQPPAAPIRVLQFGLGPIGLEVARLLAQQKRFKLVGAVDIDPQKRGVDVAKLLGERREMGVRVVESLDQLPLAAQPQVAIHATGSHLSVIAPQIEALVSRGLHVISSCEELLFPKLQHPELAQKLDALAKQHHVAVLGTGVNPGFVMDTLALCATAVCRDVKSVAVFRVVDASTRRLPLQKKIGAGLTAAEFRKLARQKKIGHVGLRESVALIADALRWQLSDIRERLRPILAAKKVRTRHLAVKKGGVAGIHQRAFGIVRGKKVISLDLKMYVGARAPLDEIRVNGDPNYILRAPLGTPGDAATVAMLVNAVPLVLAAPSGLLTVKDLPVPRFSQ
jgi:hypothetical protein